MPGCPVPATGAHYHEDSFLLLRWVCCLQYSRFQSIALAGRSKQFIFPRNAIMYVGDMYAGMYVRLKLMSDVI